MALLVRILVAFLALTALPIGVAAAEPRQPSAVLAWAYPHAPPAELPEVSPGTYHVVGSALSFTAAELNDDKNPPDWNPEQHPEPPPVVAHERDGGSPACAECHYFNGEGFLGIPDLAGLPAAYIIEQVGEFRSGRRRSAEPDRVATGQMIEVAGKVTDAELASAAAYFSSLSRHRWVRVVETDTVPETRPDYYGWLDLVPHGRTQPIDGRVIEVAEDFGWMTLEDPRSGIVAYVPIGAPARGAVLVQGGTPCGTCHGGNLKGAGNVPPLAGRSAAYLARMLWDIKTGARSGPAVALMQAPVAGLQEADIRDIAAYLASREP